MKKIPKGINHSTVLFLTVFCLVGVQFLSAGVITGRITDAATGDYLPGANVILAGTAYGTASGRAGEFRITNVPPGSYTFTVDYIGYEKYSTEVALAEDESIVHDAALNVSYVTMDEIVVEGLRQGQAKALSQQKSSDRIMNIVSAEQIERFPDPNVAEALQRLPGVSVQKDHGEGRYVIIRGTAARLNTTFINGEAIPSPEDDNRNVSLDVIPSDLMSYIEVTKALTPDMDGDAIGGSVNLITKNAFDYDGQIIKFDVSGGYRNLRGDLGQKLTFTYGNQFMDGKLGLLFGASYNNSDMATDNLELEWADSYETVTDVVDEFEVDEDDPTDTTFIYVVDEADGLVLDDMQQRLYDLRRQRIGFNLTLNYKPNDQSNFHFRFLNNTYTDEETRQMLRVRFGKSVDDEEAGSGYKSITNESGTVVRAPIYRELKARKSVSVIQSIAVGGDHHFSNFDLDYNFSTSFANELRDPSRDVVFKRKKFNLDYNIKDHKYPTFTVTNDKDFNDFSEFEFDEMEYKDGEKTLDEDITATFNISYPYSFGSSVGSFKFGGKYRGKTKESDKTNELLYEWDGEDDLMATDFEMETDGDDYMDENYVHSQGIDPDKFDDFWKDNSDFESERGLEANYYETWDATEKVTAFYGMTTLNFGKMMLLAGARVEMTSTTYNGWEGDLEEAEDEGPEGVMKEIGGSKDYTNVLPMIHLRYNPDNRTVIRGAFTKSFARPDYIDLVPFKMFEDGELTTGNLELEPTVSTNLDLMVEYYVGSLGIISGGFFSKTLTDYIYYKLDKYDEETVEGFDEVEEWLRPVNGKDATLSGFEFSWQQQLTFLPGALNGLGIYLNYTSITSEAKYYDRESTTLPGQANNIYNFALSYEKSGFTGRLSVNFHGKYIDEVGDDEDEDIWYNSNTQIDFSAIYNLMSNIALYADLININNSPLEYYQGDPDNNLPIQRELYSFGARFGIKYDF